jgi:hypothetical protein
MASQPCLTNIGDLLSSELWTLILEEVWIISSSFKAEVLADSSSYREVLISPGIYALFVVDSTT